MDWLPRLHPIFEWLMDWTIDKFMIVGLSRLQPSFEQWFERWLIWFDVLMVDGLIYHAHNLHLSNQLKEWSFDDWWIDRHVYTLYFSDCWIDYHAYSLPTPRLVVVRWRDERFCFQWNSPDVLGQMRGWLWYSCTASGQRRPRPWGLFAVRDYINNSFSCRGGFVCHDETSFC